MSRSTFTLFIGVFSAALYLFMTIFLILCTTVFNAGLETITVDTDISEETRSLVVSSGHAVKGFTLILLADFVLMFIASILMVYGVKKERHQYIGPWVFLQAIAVVLQLLVVFFKLQGDESDSEYSLFGYIVSTVIFAFIWYPVFKHYQCLKHQHQRVAVQGRQPSTAGYVVPAQACEVPSDYSHVNAKYVPVCKV